MGLSGGVIYNRWDCPEGSYIIDGTVRRGHIYRWDCPEGSYIIDGTVRRGHIYNRWDCPEGSYIDTVRRGHI